MSDASLGSHYVMALPAVLVEVEQQIPAQCWSMLWRKGENCSTMASGPYAEEGCWSQVEMLKELFIVFKTFPFKRHKNTF